MAERHFDVAIMQPGYLPWLGYFDLVATADVFVLYDDVQFDKGSWRNRNRIVGPVEPLFLSVPIRTAGRLTQSIRDTELADDRWRRVHLKTIAQTYRRAPFFDWCFPQIDRYLSEKPYRWLLDLCVDGHTALASLLGVTTPMKLSSEIGYQDAGKTQRLVAIARELGASRYVSADASKEYMVESLWDDAGIDIVYQNYPHPAYRQFVEPFQSHLSALDALMFAGPQASSFVGISHDKTR